MGFEAAKSITLPVASASVIRQRRFVKVGSTGSAEECDTANELAVGIALEASASGDTAVIPVAVFDGGVLEVEAGGTIAIGSLVATANDGQAVAATGAGTRALGVALTAGADGQIMRLMGGVASFAANS